jgi:hypothetical protein
VRIAAKNSAHRLVEDGHLQPRYKSTHTHNIYIYTHRMRLGFSDTSKRYLPRSRKYRTINMLKIILWPLLGTPHHIFFLLWGLDQRLRPGMGTVFYSCLNGLNVDVKRCEKFEPLAVKEEICPTSWLACVWLKQYCHSHQIITLGKVWLYSEIRNLRTQIDRIVASISTHGCPPRCHCFPEMLRSCAATRRCSTGCHCC